VMTIVRGQGVSVELRHAEAPAPDKPPAAP